MDERALARAVDYLDPWLGLMYDYDTLPGFVVAVAHKNKVIFNQAYGYANLEKKLKLTPDHIFRIASHSKTFTATAVMQLQEKGKLRIDDYVTDYLKWLKQHDDKQWQKVTIRQLLSHGAGVIRDGENSDYWQLEKPFPNTQQFKQEILGSRLIIENNTKLKYSNYGYTLLGMLIEEVSGKTYHQFVIENIIKPLELKNTGPEYTAAIKGKVVTGYTRPDFNKQRLPITNIDTRAMAAATGFYSTAEDMCHYFSAHVPGSGKLLSDESKKEMQKVQWVADNTKHREEYGLGLDLEYIKHRKFIGHGGGFPGNLTKSYCDTKDEIVVIVLTNANGAWPGYMARNVLKVIDFFQNNCEQKSKYEKYEGRYMNLWEVIDIVAAKDKLYVGSGESWEPLSSPDELEYLNANEFKIAKTDSFSSVEEKVKFEAGKDGQIKEVIYAGATYWPTTDYLKKMSTKRMVGD